MSTLISIGTAVPGHMHRQEDILPFMHNIYPLDTDGKRKLKFLYHQSGIETRYSVIADYTRPVADWQFYPPAENLEPFPSLERRMQWYGRHAAPLSMKAITRCLEGKMEPARITHLITVSCTGMSAPGLDLQIAGILGLPANVFRTSINFMGCYAAIHGLKLADLICRADEQAVVLIVCTELCTLHFQREPTIDNLTSSLLFADGSSAALIVGDAAAVNFPRKIRLTGFYSEIVAKGEKDMAWEITSSGFQMTLSSYVPELIGEDFGSLVKVALSQVGQVPADIDHWCIHPGGRKILQTIQKCLSLQQCDLLHCYEILKTYGNMSSPTILFVLQRIFDQLKDIHSERIFGAAFGPGLTMETFTATSVN